MPAMTKRVNVRATVAVRNTNPPIYGTYKNIIMTTGDILKCLTKRATVDEILPDGSTIRLNYKNYYTDNGAGLDAKGEIKIIKPKQPPVVKKTAPVIEKSTADISFNKNPMANASETIEVVTEGDKIEDAKAEIDASVNTDDVVKENSTIAITEENVETAEIVETKADVNTETTAEAVTKLAVEDNKDVQIVETEAAVENTKTEATTSIDKTNKEANTIEQPLTTEKKPATTSSKKKSTSNKKKK